MKREMGDGEISTRSIQDLASALLYFSQTDTSKRDTAAELEKSVRVRTQNHTREVDTHTRRGRTDGESEHIHR
jgi:hypothetical protein